MTDVVLLSLFLPPIVVVVMVSVTYFANSQQFVLRYRVQPKQNKTFALEQGSIPTPTGLPFLCWEHQYGHRDVTGKHSILASIHTLVSRLGTITNVLNGSIHSDNLRIFCSKRI